MGLFIAIPVLVFSLMVQIAIVSQLSLLQGTADLLMLEIIAWSLQENVKTAWLWSILAGLLVSFVSAAPTATPLIGYLVITGIVQFLKTRIWQAPLLTMLVSAFIGTLILHFITYLGLQFSSGAAYSLTQSLSYITLPSVLLNMFLALPVYVIIKDLANWIYPPKTEI